MFNVQKCFTHSSKIYFIDSRVNAGNVNPVEVGIVESKHCEKQLKQLFLDSTMIPGSEYNPANPDPDKELTFGLQSWDEMFIGYWSYYETNQEVTKN